MVAGNGPSAGFLWVVIVAVAVGSYGLRVSFVALLGRLDEVPRLAERILRFVPAAVLAALVLPGLLVVDGSLALSVGNERLVAGALAALVGWRTENMFATITVGMVALWTLRFVV